MQVRGARVYQLKKKKQKPTKLPEEEHAFCLPSPLASVFFSSFFSEGEKKQTMKAHILCRLGKDQLMYTMQYIIHVFTYHLS